MAEYPKGLFDHLAVLQYEQIEFAFFDREARLVDHASFTDHCPHRAEACLRSVVKRALDADAASVIVAHNHPGGMTSPSEPDYSFTKRLVKLLHPLRIKVHDHLVVTATSSFSFRSAGFL
jgi:DNA repair protein RadC